VTSSSKQLPVQRKTAEAGPGSTVFRVGGVLSRWSETREKAVFLTTIPECRDRIRSPTTFTPSTKKTSLPTKIEIRYGTVGKSVLITGDLLQAHYNLPLPANIDALNLPKGGPWSMQPNETDSVPVEGAIHQNGLTFQATPLCR